MSPSENGKPTKKQLHLKPKTQNSTPTSLDAPWSVAKIPL